MDTNSDTTTIVNPILRGMYPDPSWIWDEGSNRAVMANSSFELVPGLPLHASGGLARWEPIGYAVDAAMAGRLLIPYVLDSGGLYAPTLRRIHGRYVIACTVARLDLDAARAAGVDARTIAAVRASQGNFIIEADALEGPWRGPFWIDGAEGIDPDVFEDTDGTVYWTQTRSAPHPRWEGQTEVWTQRIDSDGWRLIGERDDDGAYGKTVIWNGYGVEGVWAEGPHLYRMDDYVYLMTAEGGTSFDHSEMMMRAHAPEGLHAALAGHMRDAREVGSLCRPAREDERTVVGRYARLFHPDRKNPFLTHRHLGVGERVQCVGHADLMRHPRLGWWLACLGSRETRTPDGAPWSFLGRETFVAPVSWQHDPAQWSLESPEGPAAASDPGWPVLAGGVGRLAAELDVAADGTVLAARTEEGSGHATFDMREPVDSRALDVQAVTVRGDDAVWYRRLPSDRCVILCPREGAVRIRQDGRHRIEFVTAGDGTVSWSAGAPGEGGPEPGRAYAGDAGVALVFAQAELRIVAAATTEEALTARPLHVIDARFLSTECSGGFVGNLVGVAAER